jgi:glycosyltransferase involved in cell wall biosynthesis
MSEAKDISVIIPSRNRKDILLKCLSLYREQVLDPKRFEVILIDDGSDTPIKTFVDPRLYPFHIHLVRQEALGPAAARNAGISLAQGRIFLFSGDDIFPDTELLQGHLEAHTLHHPDPSIAILGLIEWPADLEVNALMEYVTTEGEQQFAFRGLVDGQEVDYKRFYSSNISLKKEYIQGTGELFSMHFSEAAFEDTEFGYRLERLHRLKIIFDSRLRAFHWHPMDLASFYCRQFKAGQMAVVLDRMHPDIFEEETKILLRKTDFPVSQNIPQCFLEHYQEIRRMLGLFLEQAEMLEMMKKVERHFLNEVLLFGFSSGASDYFQKSLSHVQ